MRDTVVVAVSPPLLFSAFLFLLCIGCACITRPALATLSLYKQQETHFCGLLARHCAPRTGLTTFPSPPHAHVPLALRAQEQTRPTAAVTASSDAVLWWWLDGTGGAAAKRCCRLASHLGGSCSLLAATTAAVAAAVAGLVHLLAPRADAAYGVTLALLEDRTAPASAMALAFAPPTRDAPVSLWVACEDRGLRVWDVPSLAAEGDPGTQGDDEPPVQSSPRYRSALLGPSPLISCTVSRTSHGSVRAGVGDAAGVLRIFDAASGDYRLLGEVDVAHAVAAQTASEAGCLRVDKAAAHSDDPIVAVAGVGRSLQQQQQPQPGGTAGSASAASCERAGVWIAALADAAAVVDMDTLAVVQVCLWRDGGGPAAAIGTCTLAAHPPQEGGAAATCVVASPFSREAQVLSLWMDSLEGPPAGGAARAYRGPGRPVDAAPDGKAEPALSLQARSSLPPDSPLRAVFEPKATPSRGRATVRKGLGEADVSVCG